MTFLLDLINQILDFFWTYRSHLFIYSIPLVLGLIVFEALYFGWHHSSLKRLIFNRSISASTDIGLCLLRTLGIDALIASILTFGLIHFIPNLAKQYLNFDFISIFPNQYVQIFLYAILYDFLWYWKHRFAHKYAWWWHLHEVHHSASEMNIITANRFHPIDIAIGELLVCIPMAIFGVPPNGYLFARLISLLHGSIIHSNFNWTWGWLGRYVIISPVAHRLHHSNSSSQQNKNFGTITPIWDRIFGTWSDEQATSLGVQEKYKNVFAYILIAYVKFIKSIHRVIKKYYNLWYK